VVFQDRVPDTLEIRLASRAGTPFRILRADLDGGGFQLGPVPEGEAPEQVLRIRRTASAPARAVLVLRCSGLEETLEVPVVYVPSGPS